MVCWFVEFGWILVWMDGNVWCIDFRFGECLVRGLFGLALYGVCGFG